MTDETYFVYEDETADGADCIRALFAHTGPDGTLRYAEYRYENDAADDRPHPYWASMNWRESDCEAAVKDFCGLCEDLRVLAEAEEIPSEGRLRRVYDTYVAPTDPGELDGERIGEIGMELFLDRANAPSEDVAYYGRWEELVREDARQRLGESPFSPALLTRARRYHRLLACRAPRIIVALEERKFAKAFAMLRCCREQEEA